MTTCSNYYSVTEVADSLSKKVVIKIEDTHIDGFQLKMLQGDCIGILKPTVSNDEKFTYLTYEISNCISMKYYFDTPREPESMIDVLLDIVDVVSDSKNYYLNHSSFLYDKRYMYYDSMTSSVKLIYIPIKYSLTEDVLAFLKSEMLKDLHSSYNEGKYTEIMFCLLKATTLSNLKHMLLDIESKMFEYKISEQKQLEDEIKLPVEPQIEENSSKVKSFKMPDLTKKKVLKDKKEIKVNPLKASNSSKKKSDKLIIPLLSGALCSALICWLGLKITAPIIITIPVALITGSCIGYFANKLVNKVTSIEKNDTCDHRVNLKEEVIMKKSVAPEVVKGSLAKTVLLKKKFDNKRLINIATGEAYVIDFKGGSSCSLGRGEHSEIMIGDSSIGRNHLQISDLNGDIYIMDNNTLNGSFVNSTQLVPLKKYILTHGDEVVVGSTTLRFEVV